MLHAALEFFFPQSQSQSLLTAADRHPAAMRDVVVSASPPIFKSPLDTPYQTDDLFVSARDLFYWGTQSQSLSSHQREAREEEVLRVQALVDSSLTRARGGESETRGATLKMEMTEIMKREMGEKEEREGIDLGLGRAGMLRIDMKGKVHLESDLGLQLPLRDRSQFARYYVGVLSAIWSQIGTATLRVANGFVSHQLVDFSYGSVHKRSFEGTCETHKNHVNHGNHGNILETEIETLSNFCDLTPKWVHENLPLGSRVYVASDGQRNDQQWARNPRAVIGRELLRMQVCTNNKCLLIFRRLNSIVSMCVLMLTDRL